MFSDVLPHLAGLSHAFQRKDVSFTVVKPLVTGTQAAINAFLVTPGEHFQYLSAVFSELEDYGVKSPTDSQMKTFKRDVYSKYLHTLLEHISQCFPDIKLLEGFSIFDASSIPRKYAQTYCYECGVNTRITSNSS